MIVELKVYVNEKHSQIYFIRLKDISLMYQDLKRIYFKKRSNVDYLTDVTNFDEILEKFKEYNK